MLGIGQPGDYHFHANDFGLIQPSRSQSAVGLETMFQNLPDCPLLNKAETAAKVAKAALTHLLDFRFSLLAETEVARGPHPPGKGDRSRRAHRHLKGPFDEARFREPAGRDQRADRCAKPGGRSQTYTADRIARAGGSPGAVPLLKDALNSVQDEAGKLEAWFNATMVRVSARFTTYVRLWTVAFALTLCARNRT